MEEKRRDLTSEKQKVLLDRLVNELSRSTPDLYYQSTNNVAMAVKAYAAKEAGLTQDEKVLIEPLSWRDIQFILGLHTNA